MTILIDWCLTPTLVKFKLYRVIDNSVNLSVVTHTVASISTNAY